MDTSLAKHGSNFGLPIAHHLINLMGGSIGIVEVTHVWIWTRVCLCMC